DAVISREEQLAVEVCQLHRVGAVRIVLHVFADIVIAEPRIDVLNEDGTGGSAVALPQFAAVNAVVGREEQLAVNVCQVGGARAAAADVDILDHQGAGRGAVTLPQFAAVNAVIGREEQFAVDIGQVRRVGTDARTNDGDDVRAGLGPIALPQLSAVPLVRGD